MPAKERSFRAEGVVLRHSDFGEADRLLTIYTREAGKVRVLAKGVRKSRSRKAGHVEPFTRVNLQLARGRDLLILTQAEAVAVYANLRNDLVVLGYASYLIELLDQSTYDEEENRALYDLLTRSLTRYYELRLLDYVGFRPQLFACTQCEEEIQPQDQFFSASRGGVLCPKCGTHAPETRPITEKTLKYLRHLQRSSYREASRATIALVVFHEMETLMQYYLTHNLERGLNTPSFLRRVRQEQTKSSK